MEVADAHWGVVSTDDVPRRRSAEPHRMWLGDVSSRSTQVAVERAPMGADIFATEATDGHQRSGVEPYLIENTFENHRSSNGEGYSTGVSALPDRSCAASLSAPFGVIERDLGRIVSVIDEHYRDNICALDQIASEYSLPHPELFLSADDYAALNALGDDFLLSETDSDKT
eukprot:TRINITY_DN74754_c0_g1_i1.p2 TRINITY_DN74754_c0_g1~~TRINITY_DN74754_c0_g1_i1.p2  ORF type:complete len:171 (-),score=24.63 TRINITY_DN74754_c0_g1_i1:328-840(-)